MNVSPRAVEMIKHHEGVRAKPYRCPAALWTVGVGHVLYPEQALFPIVRTAENLSKPLRSEFPLRTEDNRVWTDAEVDNLLTKDLRRFERGVATLCPSVVGRQSRFDALVSFAFNCGLGRLQRSTLRMKLNRGDVEGAADEFMKYSKAGGKVLPGLLKRRKDERALFLSAPEGL